MNKFLPIKLIAVFLAIITSIYVAYSTVDMLSSVTFPGKEYGSVPRFSFLYLSTLFEHGSIDDIKSTEIYESHSGYIEENMQTLIELGGNDKESYEKYKSAMTEEYSRYFSNLSLLEKDGSIDYFALQTALINDEISCSFIAPHKTHTLSATLNGENEEVYHYIDHRYGELFVTSNADVYDSNGYLTTLYATFSSIGSNVSIDIDDDDEYYYDDDDDDEIDIVATTSATSYGSYGIFPDSARLKINNKHGKIPDSIQKKNNLPIVELCNLAVDDMFFDGYFIISPTQGHEYLSNFAEYQKQFNETYSILNEENDLWWAIVDCSKSKVLYSNKSDLAGKPMNEALSFFEKAEGDASTNGNDLSFSDAKKAESDYIYLTAYMGEDASGAIKHFENNYGNFYENSTEYLIKIAICSAIMIFLLAIMIIFAGRKSGSNELFMLKTDKIFTLLRISVSLAAISGLFVAAFFVAKMYLENDLSEISIIILLGSICIVSTLIVFDICTYIARNIKNHTLIKRIFIVWLVLIIASAINKGSQKRKIIKENFGDVEKRARLAFIFFIAVFFILAVNCFISIWAESAIFASIFGISGFFWAVGFGVYFLLYARSIRIILEGVNRLGNGEVGVAVDPNFINVNLRKYAVSLNKASAGAKIAVEKAMQEKNTRTELITNVSHDLKTPLTSIINYVDLLSRTNIEDEAAKEYIEILKNKSQRLKSLIEDLIEASKATTGNVNVQLSKINLTELAMQLCGEYEDEMAEANLELDTAISNQKLSVLADMQMTYRVLDNLFSNAKKYSLPGTRVYFDVEKLGSNAVVKIKNVSATRLNISPQELKQRFTRGDESRSGSGSGLGLSIAESFCEMMNANLTLNIDGDMFTSIVSFPLIENNE